MHPSLSHQPMPAALMPFVPPVRRHHSGVRFELGQIAPEPVPPRPYRDPEDLTHLRPLAHQPQPCPDCGAAFTPRATNHVRCWDCGRVKLRAERATRWIRERDAQRARRSAAASRRQAA